MWAHTELRHGEAEEVKWRKKEDVAVLGAMGDNFLNYYRQIYKFMSICSFM